MYYDGEGTARNYPEALKWFSQAANRGIVNAYRALGHMYEHGNGVERGARSREGRGILS